VFSGDVVNTASRIQGLCRPLSADFPASTEVLARAELPDGVEATPLGEHSLRGRAAPVRLLSLSDSTVGAAST